MRDSNGNDVVLRGISFIDLGATEEWQGGARRRVDRLTNTNDFNERSTRDDEQPMP